MAAGCGGGREESTSGGTGGGASPGITDDTVTLGTSTALSGPASAYGVIAQANRAYFEYVNQELGGVKMADGKTRRIELVVYDDGRTPVPDQG